MNFRNIKKIYNRFINVELKIQIYLAVFFILAVWQFCTFLGYNELKSWDEAIYAVVARNINESGNWLQLRFMDQVYFKKPPLYFYSTVLFYKIFGVNEFSARITSALFGIGCLILIAIFSEKVFNRKTALLSVILLLSNFHFIFTIRHGRMESMVTFFILLACYSFYRMVDNPRWVYLLAISTALGTLAKGPMGLMAFFVIVPFVLLNKKWRKSFWSIHTIGAFLLLLVIGLPWYLLQYKIYGQEYFNEFLGVQIVDRINMPIEGHVRQWWYYIETMSVHYFSNWSLLIFPVMIYMLIKIFYIAKPGETFFTLFSWVVLLIFTFGVGTKLPWYIFILYLPAAVLVAYCLNNNRVVWFRNIMVISSLLIILIYPVTLLKKDTNYLKSMKPFFEQELSSDSKVLYYGKDYPEVVYYTHAIVRNVLDINILNEALDEGTVDYALIPEMILNQVSGHHTVLCQNEKFALIKR